MKRNIEEEMRQLYTDTMKEIFTPEEQEKITLISRRNSIGMNGPLDLQKRLFEATERKMRR